MQAIRFLLEGPVADIRLFSFLGLVLFLCMIDIRGATLVTAPYIKTNLISFLAEWTSTPASVGAVCELKPQWVGTVKRAYLRGGEGIYKEDQPNNIRFSHLMVFSDRN